MLEFKLPDLGEGIHECEILSWHVQPGELIVEDEPLVEVETDKAAMTLPSPGSGRIVSLAGEAGDTVLVGEVLAVIDTTGNGEPPASPAVAREKEAAPLAEPAPAAVATARAHEDTHGRAVAAPSTRRLARELGIDIQLVLPSGPAGRVTREDVELFARSGGAPIEEAPAATGAEDRPQAPAQAPAASAIPFLDLDPLPDFEEWGPVESVPLRSIRRKIARRMVTSMILVPHVAQMDEVDVTPLDELRRRERERRAGAPGGRLTLLPFVIKAVCAGLKAAPAFNASVDPFNERIVYKRYFHVGVAVDTEQGLVVPVVRDADRKSVLEISAEIEELAGRARRGELAAADMRGGTFTITNVGPDGGTAMIPTINYPEAAILAMGRVQPKPLVVDGEIAIRTVLPLTLAFDHRVADGAEAARFVSELVRRLSDPDSLLLEI